MLPFGTKVLLKKKRDETRKTENYFLLKLISFFPPTPVLLFIVIMLWGVRILDMGPNVWFMILKLVVKGLYASLKERKSYAKKCNQEKYLNKSYWFQIIEYTNPKGKMLRFFFFPFSQPKK